MNLEEMVDAGAEVSDGEEVPPTVPDESRVEKVFAEVEQRGGLAWRQRGILPLLVVSIFSWGIKFPTVPTVVRGVAADSLCDLAPRVKSLWNKGACAFSDFLQSTGATVTSRSKGRDNRGFEGSRTCSFVLPDSAVNCLAPGYIKVGSKALLAAKGPWMTCGHIEPAGGESIAKLSSGRKLWIIATNISSSKFLMSIQSFDHFYQLLMGAKSKRSKTHKQDKRNIRGLRFHLAEEGDVLIQPACYAHCVLTGRAFAADGSTRWALVHGWEGLDLRDTRRATVVFNNFSTGCGRGYISQWLKRYGKDKLLSLLTVRDWKLALAAWRKFQVQVSLNPAISLSRAETTVRSFLSRSDVLEHFEAFVNYGFNLEAHLHVPEMKPLAKSRRKKNRSLANFKKGDLTSSEAPALLGLTSDEELDLPVAAVVECMPRDEL